MPRPPTSLRLPAARTRALGSRDGWQQSAIKVFRLVARPATLWHRPCRFAVPLQAARSQGWTRCTVGVYRIASVAGIGGWRVRSALRDVDYQGTEHEAPRRAWASRLSVCGLTVVQPLHCCLRVRPALSPSSRTFLRSLGEIKRAVGALCAAGEWQNSRIVVPSMRGSRRDCSREAQSASPAAGSPVPNLRIARIVLCTLGGCTAYASAFLRRIRPGSSFCGVCCRRASGV
ncbi:hypothetical protein OH76DRAFT_1189898 [Lentinus brumalis]|uniref:Uncharacterized protein n=1 Tax=Lentinus brumalis TaxID=2498619 RepID=A0A371CTG0_9APHY|nr:hypothetical protein OH76DRAFT_1189898 [Polyporus brumalis]